MEIHNHETKDKAILLQLATPLVDTHESEFFQTNFNKEYAD